MEHIDSGNGTIEMKAQYLRILEKSLHGQQVAQRGL
jgi:hypothetical protein